MKTKQLLPTLAIILSFIALLPGHCLQAAEEKMAEPASGITVAAAADMKFALDELVGEFNEKNPANKVNVTFGSSGNFFAQIQNGAPFDLFLSADIQYPKKLADAGLAADEVFLYGIGKIVLWVPKESPLNVQKLGMQAMLDSSVKKIAIANPDHAPYGRAAVAAMKNLKVYEQVQLKLALGENIAQTAQFVQSGAADIGILALSLAVAPKMKESGKYWEIPPDAYPKMEQGGIILKSSKNIQGARAFRDYLLSEHGRDVLKRYGFCLPEK